MLSKKEIFLNRVTIYKREKVNFIIVDINGDQVDELILKVNQGTGFQIYIFSYDSGEIYNLYRCKNKKIEVYTGTGILKIGSKFYRMGGKKIRKYNSDIQRISVKKIISSVAPIKSFLDLDKKNKNLKLINTDKRKISTIVSDLTDWLGVCFIYRYPKDRKWIKHKLDKMQKKEIVEFAKGRRSVTNIDNVSEKRISLRLFGKNVSKKYETFIGEWGEHIINTQILKLTSIDNKRIKVDLCQ